jgi:hypothetical protein
MRWFQRAEILPFLDEDGKGGGNPAEGFARLLERHGGSYEAVARHLYEDNYDYRRTNRELKTTLDDLKGKVPSEGAVVLGKDDAQLLDAYRQLGKPEELKAGLDERTTLKSTLDARQKTDLMRDVARTAGFKEDVLTRYGANLDYEIRELDQDGTKVKAAFVKDGDTAVPVVEHFADLLPALKVDATGSATGTQFVRQNVGGKAPDTDLVTAAAKRLQEQRDARGANPLKPA